MRLRVIGGAAAGVIALLAGVTVLTARSGDRALWPPADDASGIEIHVVNHGYHSGIVLDRVAMAAMAEAAERGGHAALIAVAQRFANYRWLEFGWGDEEFYRNVPDAASLTFQLAIRALFWPGNASVVHAVGLNSHPSDAFPTSDVVRIPLSSRGFALMLNDLDASFGRGAGSVALEPLGPGLYGPSSFYRGADSFHVFNVCNHWVARLLSTAGLPTAPLLATVPPGLLLQLKWRAGLAPLPRR
jgi:uncharacterized protein (TIGR02117 family)